MRLNSLLKLPLAGILAVLLLHTSNAWSAQPTGDYILGGKGTLLINLDGAGNFTGSAWLPIFGLVNIQGTAPVDASGKISGVFTLSDRTSGGVVYAGALSGTASSANTVLLLRLATKPALNFRGGLRTGAEPVPGGQYFASALPISLIIQCDRSGDRQTISVQGDQDFGLDLTQAFGGQLLFDQRGIGYGSVYENGDPSTQPRKAFARYNMHADKLKLTIHSTLIGGKMKSIAFSGVGSSGKFDGIYNVNIVAGDCPAVPVKVTIKNGLVSGSDTNTGTIAGTIDDSGNLSFTTQRLTITAACSQNGSHIGTITFTGTPSINPVFPNVIDGTFTGAGATGTFTVSQPTGITGATTPGGVPRAESWAGTLTGIHKSQLAPGGVFAESFTVSFNFPSSLIKALRGKSTIVSGSGSMSGSETVQTQAPFPTTISSLTATTLGGATLTVTFAGFEGGPGPSIEFESPSVLISNTVHIYTGPQAGMDLSENRKIIKLRVRNMSATSISGGWLDGRFTLRKQ